MENELSKIQGVDLLAKDLGSDTNCIDNLPVGPAGEKSMGRRRKELRRSDLSPVVVTRFRKKIHITSSCWLWTGTKERNGYGLVYVSTDALGRKVRHYAHRVAYVLAHGYVPSHLEVMHSCDIPGCVNPSHLSLGTHSENIADRTRKGRHGRRKPTIRKIDAAGVVEIRRNTRPSQEWADHFGVCVSHINRIRRGEKRKVD